MSKLSIKDLKLQGKKVLMRVDFNVPLKEDFTISDDTRIRLSLPSIQYVLDQGGSIILMSHLGRPKGKPDPAFSLKPCATHLSQLLGINVIMAPDCIGATTRELVQHLQPGQIILLENLRFHEEEEHPEKDSSFAKTLASYGDVYVNDAFGTAHRAHSSTATIAKYFPHKAAMGFLMEKEVHFLLHSFTDPKRPFYAIIGGAKIDSKIGALKSILQQVDGIFIGGGMAFTFLKAQNIPIGDSICDESMLPVAKEFMEKAKELRVPFYLPEDVVIAKDIKENTETETIDLSAKEIPKGFKGLDIGPKTLNTWKLLLDQAGTIFWNGPVGVFEISTFAQGTFEIARILGSLKNAITIVGGGDSVAAVSKLNLTSQFTHVSTGGGASLELIEYGHLPGIDALSEK